MKVFPKVIALVFALMFSSLVLAADEVDVSKLPDSTLTSDQIKEVLADKKLEGKQVVKHFEVTYQFNKNGYFYVNSNVGSDSGSWTVENNTLCLTFRRYNDSCNNIVTVSAGKLRVGEWLVQK